MGNATSEGKQFWVLKEWRGGATPAVRQHALSYHVHHEVKRVTGETAPQVLREVVGLEPDYEPFDPEAPAEFVPAGKEPSLDDVMPLTDQEVLNRDDVQQTTVEIGDGLGKSHTQPVLIFDNQDDYMVMVALTRAAIGATLVNLIIDRQA